MQVAFDSITSRSYVHKLGELFVYSPDDGNPKLSYEIVEESKIGALRSIFVLGVGNYIHCIDPIKLEEEQPLIDPKCLVSTFDVNTINEDKEAPDVVWSMSTVAVANLVLVAVTYPERSEVSVNCLHWKAETKTLVCFRRFYLSTGVVGPGDTVHWTKDNHYWVWNGTKFSRTDGKISFECRRRPFYDEWHHVFYYISSNYNVCQLEASAVSSMGAKIIAGRGASDRQGWDPPESKFESREQYLQEPIANVDAVMVTRNGELLLRCCRTNALCNLGNKWFDNAATLAMWLKRSPIPVFLNKNILEIIHGYACITYYFDSNVSEERILAATQMLIS